ncbi:hypothetical protein [Vandammella animalimorsus]|uniref:hypothetical protein n=1 Tax=Vandammella animalimorsus TaxID=2029117 RepID=UPI0011774F2C|nr:hypothetical protein [Vandammella animalimorsus]
MHTLRTLSLAAALALLAAPTPAQEQHMPRAEPAAPQAEQVAAFDNWLEQASPRIAWRNNTIDAIVQRMAPQLMHLPEGHVAATQLTQGLHRMSDDQLRAAAAHQQLQDLELAIHQGASAPSVAPPEGVEKYALGDEVNLVFVPITPCRIADSRKATAGRLQRNLPRGYFNHGSAGQGGQNDCNAQYSYGMKTGTLGALALTVTAAQAERSGHLSISPWNESSSASVLNFRPGTAIANSTVVKTTGFPGQPDFQITANQNTHVIVDLLGFYLPNEPTALDCKTTAYTRTTLTGSSTAFDQPWITAPQCEAGYTQVAIRCQVEEWPDSTAVLTDMSPNACRYRYTGAEPITVRAASRCCRVPGVARSRL